MTEFTETRYRCDICGNVSDKREYIAECEHSHAILEDFVGESLYKNFDKFPHSLIIRSKRDNYTLRYSLEESKTF